MPTLAAFPAISRNEAQIRPARTALRHAAIVGSTFRSPIAAPASIDDSPARPLALVPSMAS